MNRKLTSDAGTLPGTEGFIRMRWPAPRIFRQKPVRIEPAGIGTPHLGIAVHHRQQHDRPILRTHRNPVGERYVFSWAPPESRGGRPEAQGLVYAAAQIPELGKRLVTWC